MNIKLVMPTEEERRNVLNGESISARAWEIVAKKNGKAIDYLESEIARLRTETSVECPCCAAHVAFDGTGHLESCDLTGRSPWVQEWR